MIDVRQVRQDPDAARAALARRRDATALAQLDRVVALDQRRRLLVARVEQLQAARNAQSGEVARRKRAGESADDLLAQLKVSSEEVRQLEADLKDLEALLDEHLLSVPNFLLPQVPDGDADANRVLRSWGEPRRFDFVAQAHWDLGQRLGLFDLARGAKLTGSGFPLFTGAGARLVRALANFLLDLHTMEHGYVEVQPPYVVNRASLTGTGQLPKFEDDLYRMAGDELFLIPTAEVPVTNLHRDEILDARELPVALTAYTPCFRREAGAHGKDTRGLIRVHQFDKVELVRLVRSRHERCGPRDHHGPRRVGAAATRAAVPRGAARQRRYRLCQRVDVRSRSVGARRRATGSRCRAPALSPTSRRAAPTSAFAAPRTRSRNSSTPSTRPALAFPRTIIALLEHGQQADGSVVLPAALVPYAGTDRLAPRA